MMARRRDAVADLWTELVADEAAQRAERRAGERARLAAIMARATPPEDCGPAIIAAPAAGPRVTFAPSGLVPSPEVAEPAGIEDYQLQHLGWLGRSAVRSADVFDRMLRAARGVSPFSSGQVAMARHYRTLTERHAAGGMRCSSLEAQRAGGGGAGGEFIDAYVEAGRQLDRIHRRIGTGPAMAVRRVRPSKRGPAASIITDRVLVDAVCLADMTLQAVLERYGWAANGSHRAALQRALAAALDRMQGFD